MNPQPKQHRYCALETCHKVILKGKYCNNWCQLKASKRRKKVVVVKNGRKTAVGAKTAKLRAWKAFSMYIRTKYNTCYTCGNKLFMKDRQCGHGIGGRGGMVLFDEDICRTQDAQCNVFLKGNYPVFVSKLIRENGLEWYENKLIQSKQIKKYSIQEYLDIEEKYKLKLKEEYGSEI